MQTPRCQMTAGRFMCADPSCISPCCPETAGTGPLPLRRCVQAERGGACSCGSAAGTLRGQSPRRRARRARNAPPAPEPTQPGAAGYQPPCASGRHRCGKTPTVDKKGNRLTDLPAATVINSIFSVSPAAFPSGCGYPPPPKPAVHPVPGEKKSVLLPCPGSR